MNDTLVLDLETKKSFDEVGGRDRFDLLGISVAGLYSYQKNSFMALEEHELNSLRDLLKNTRTLVGFCVNQFDFPVLKSYLPEFSPVHYNVVDIFDDAVEILGHRVKLNSVAQATLGVSKSGNGLEALRWFKEGRIGDVKKYCLDDVKITRDIYEYGKKHGHILFDSYLDGAKHSIPVRWNEALGFTIKEALDRAFNERKSLSIEYVSSSEDAKLGFKKSRLIDIYKMNGDSVEAYCHLRNDVRSFRINRILTASLTNDSYFIPQDFQKSLF